MKQELHNHIYLCRHAIGTPLELARRGQKLGLEVIGISDHAALPDNRWPDIRMSYSELDLYDQLIEDAKKAVPTICILKGFECEGLPEYFTYYKEELLEKRGFNYLIGSGHYIWLKNQWQSSFSCLNQPQALELYTEQLVGMIESGLFAFIAHPDLFGLCFESWNLRLETAAKAIAQASKAKGVPLEINGNGYWRNPVGGRAPFPWASFWEVVAHVGAPVVINSDAHSPDQLGQNKKQSLALAQNLGLTLWGVQELGLGKSLQAG